jgi:hypothetical protein
VERKPGQRILLHFGAVDYLAKVWINDHLVGTHEGGHTPFTFDITPTLTSSGPQKVTVRVEDDPHDLAKPRGKQDWQRDPHSIWYPRTTGIWQTVFIETVSETYIERITWSPDVESWEIGFSAYLSSMVPEGVKLRLRLSIGDKILADDEYRVTQDEVHRHVELYDPGIDDFRQYTLWSPENPTLIDAQIELWKDGVCIDSIQSYTALRSVSTHNNDFLLNGKPYYLRLVLDQGYWPESLMTAPTQDALRYDVELIKAMGFNGVRKHQKIEDPQFLYWADVMGLLVWEEMPSAYRFSPEAVGRLTREWIEVITRDYNHPCIVVWVPFNESWGVPDLADKMVHVNYVQALYYLTKTLDPSRLVVGNDGWEHSTTDIIGIHDYDNAPHKLLLRYDSAQPLNSILYGRSPAGKLIALQGLSQAADHTGHPIMLTEFGGIACKDYRSEEESPLDEKVWGYSVAQSGQELLREYAALMQAIHKLTLFRGFCYTQFADTFQEANGLLYADRKPKIPLSEIAAITRGTYQKSLEEGAFLKDEKQSLPHYIEVSENSPK